MYPEDYIDVDAAYEDRTARDEAFDDFTSEVTCEEYYEDEGYYDEDPDVDESQ